MKVIPGEVCARLKLLVCTLLLNFKIPLLKTFIPKRRVWRLRDPDIQMDFREEIGTLSGSYYSTDAWKKGVVSKDEYLVAKRTFRHIAYAAEKAAEEKKFRCIKERDPKIFKIAKQIKKGNQDVAGKKCLR